MNNKLDFFFQSDLFIKKEIVTNQPNEMDIYDPESLIKYTDNLFSLLNQLEIIFLKINKDFNYNYHDFITNTFKKYNNDLINCGTDYYKLLHFYKEDICGINISLINEVNQSFGGYLLDKDMNLLLKSKSVDEILHVLHRMITTDEHNLASLPVLSTKKLINNESVTLYGTKNEIGNVIYKLFPSEIDCGNVMITSLSNDHVIMMIRDLGHALSIDITKDQKSNMYYVNYFIPKVCNYIKANELPGINPVNETSKYAIGSFQANNTNLCAQLFNFISHVPTDLDMDLPGGKYYQAGLSH